MPSTDQKALLRALQEQGFEVEKTSGNHLKVRRPGGRFVIIGSTTGRGRGIKNAVQQLKQIGYQP